MTTVADLVRRARDARVSIAGQHAAFAVLVERFEAMAFTTALRSCGDADSARDACQEAFVVAWQKLASLREPAAFGSWLQRLVRTRCARARRRDVSAQSRAREIHDPSQHAVDTAEVVGRRETEILVRRAVLSLPRAEREAVVRHYFLGEALRAVGRVLGVSAARAGRLVYEARLVLRRELPRSVTDAFLKKAARVSFTRRLQAGLFDELTGEYRFDERPDHRIVVRREGDVLASYAGGQRNILTSRRPDTIVPTEYDGEARVRRDRRGRVTHFIYYEFGRRLGTARRVPAS
jgi:RNA polymerase sigma-70 factor (ECF subfamily)